MFCEGNGKPSVIFRLLSVVFFYRGVILFLNPEDFEYWALRVQR